MEIIQSIVEKMFSISIIIALITMLWRHFLKKTVYKQIVKNNENSKRKNEYMIFKFEIQFDSAIHNRKKISKQNFEIFFQFYSFNGYNINGFVVVEHKQPKFIRHYNMSDQWDSQDKHAISFSYLDFTLTDIFKILNVYGMRNIMRFISKKYIEETSNLQIKDIKFSKRTESSFERILLNKKII